MFENLFIKIYDFAGRFGLSPHDLRSAAMILIFSAFVVLLVMTFFVHARALFLLVKNSQSPKEIKEQKTSNKYVYDIWLILDLFSRGVSEFKTAQIVMNKAGKKQTREQVWQVVSYVRRVVDFCKNESGFDKKIEIKNFADGNDAFFRNKVEKITKAKAPDIDVVLTKDEEFILDIIESNKVSNKDKMVSNLFRSTNAYIRSS